MNGGNTMPDRNAKISRKTFETDINTSINLDGKGNCKISTGIGFFDHMLNQFSKHGFIDMDIKSIGDLNVDCHHTVEDTGIALGKCINIALGERIGIKRYGAAYVPMDESLAFVCIDLSGRPFLVFDCSFESEKVGDFDIETVEEFFRALCMNSGMTLHMKIMYGKNNHHKVEALFKAFARAFAEAVSIDSRVSGVMSTKGYI
jgi:imidazoleglycerol-phosphate dehydratase